MNDAEYLSAVAAVAAMRNGDISAEDYASALLTRTDALKNINAFISLDRDKVLEAARAADRMRASGSLLGALHGLPIPVKDSVNSMDLPSSSGTAALRAFWPHDDAGVLKRLLAQGAILMGKTNMDELSYGFTSNNSVFGAVHNPYDSRRIPGGSSGGSAAAVAARMAPLAVAEDTLGSIRIPAHMCGLAGFRPSFGRYPNDGVLPLTDNKFDQVGPLARNVADLALFDMAVTGDTSPLSATPLSGVRIGISPEYFLSGLHPDVERIWTETLRTLSAAGVTLVSAEIPEIATVAQPMAFTIIGYDTLPSVSAFLAAQDTGITFDQLLHRGSADLQAQLDLRALSPNRPAKDAFEQMLDKRRQLKDAVRDYFAMNNVAALAFPPLSIVPPKIGDTGDIEFRGRKIPFYAAMARNVALSSCASLASLVLPAGMTTDGLPIGVEFDAPSGADRRLLSLGISLEAALGPVPSPKV